MKACDELSSSMEDYLETIALLKKENDVARVRDIGSSLAVKSSSVNAALKNLSQKGLVVYERYGYVNLTTKGEEVAAKVQDKHDVLLKFLTKVLSIDNDIASEDACKMEHAISAETFAKLSKFIQFVEIGMGGDNSAEWLKRFNHYLRTGKIVEMQSTASYRSKGR
ncbi:MAG: metal-dependent transcriptional regulator [Nitrospinae bacterium]|nr:metal-dependent transcriptional regulator [Nitrospinota bacterium]